MSPYADLTLAGTTMDTKRAVDPLLSRENQAATADVEVALDITPGGTPRLPGLLPDLRRSGRRTGQSRTAPVRAARQRRTRHRLAKRRNVSGSRNHGPFSQNNILKKFTAGVFVMRCFPLHRPHRPASEALTSMTGVGYL
jgi:hypothetical protein